MTSDMCWGYLKDDLFYFDTNAYSQHLLHPAYDSHTMSFPIANHLKSLLGFSCTYVDLNC